MQNYPFQPLQEKAAPRSKLMLLLLSIVLIGGGIGLSQKPNTDPIRAGRTFASELVLFDVARAKGIEEPVTPPAPPKPVLPERVKELPPGETFSAARMIVVDHGTGARLYEKQPKEQWPIASISKLMTALVLLERPIIWDAKLSALPGDFVDAYVVPGDVLTTRELWRAMLVASSNRAAETLVAASGLPQDAFIARMNQKAVELGMGASYFDDPTGLSSDNVSTADDIAVLLSVALANEDIRQAVQEKEVTILSSARKKSLSSWNTNWLLLGWIPHTFAQINGGKTGFIPAARYNVATQIQTTDGRVLDVVILGASSHEARFTEAKDIANAVHAAYRWPGDTRPVDL